MVDEGIIAGVVADLKIEFGEGLLGVIAGGSRIRGEGDASSDIDLPVIIAEGRRQRRNIVVQGVEVEMFINPPAQVRRYFAEDHADGTGATIHLYVTGRTVHDAGGAATELRREALELWQAGPPLFTANDAWQARYFAADQLRDIEDVLPKDPDRVTYLVGLLVPWLLGRHYRIRHKWRPKHKRLLLDLAAWDGIGEAFARGAMNGDVGAARALAEHVIAPIGGLMPLEWQTEWEEVAT